MINGLEGIPGSGKSFEAVVFHVFEALRAGRKVITNLPLVVELFAAVDPSFPALIEIRKVNQPIRGVWDRSAAGRDEPAFRLFEDGRTDEADQTVPLFGGVWDYYTVWKGPSGQGPVFVIDESHVALPVQGTGADVVEWYKLHRHFNVDVLLMTQNFRDMNQPIARMIAMLIKCRKADILGRPDCYIRKVHAGYRGAVIQTDERKYKPEFFPFYKSHTQGNSVMESGASDVAPMIVKFNRIKYGFFILAAASVVYAAIPFFTKGSKSAYKPSSATEASAPVQQGGRWVPEPGSFAAGLPQNQPGGKYHSDTVQAPEVAPAPHPPASAPGQPPEPFAGKQIHLSGRIELAGRSLYSFVMSAGGVRQLDLTSDDLKRAGYVVEAVTECIGTLRWKTITRTVLCDAPILNTGSSGMPVVVATTPPPKGN